MNKNQKHPFIYTATLIASMIFYVSIPSQGQDAQVPSNSNNAATISGLVDRIDALEQEKKDLRSIKRSELSKNEKIALKDELKEVKKDLNQERNKLNTIQGQNFYRGPAFGYYGGFRRGIGLGYGFSPYRRGFIGRGFYGRGGFGFRRGFH